MAFDLTLPIAMRMAGPALFFLLGLAMVSLARGRLERLALGAFILSTGGFLAAANLYLAGGGTVFLVVQVAFTVVTSVAGVTCLAWPAIRPRVAAPWLVVIGLFVAAYALREALTIGDFAARNVVYGKLGSDFMRALVLDLQFGGIGQAFLFGLPFAWAIQAKRAAPHELRLLAGFSSGLLVFIGFAAGTDVLSGYNVTLVWAPELACIGILAAAAAWLWVAVKRESAVARNVALAAFSALFLGMLRHAVTGVDSVLDPYGTLGVARLAGWVILALTVVHAGWLDIRFLSRHRTGIAMAALATLFIVAQVAQNFFSAEFGLYTGGIVAGAFLFVASPVQKAIERINERKSVQVLPRSSKGENDEAFRAAVQFALRDRRLSHAEEMSLADLAERLGIGVKRATEIRHQVELEKGVA
jgi:hypothetical protein